MKTRIISGAVAIVLLIGVLILHSTIFFDIAFSLIGCLMVYELFKAFKLEKNIGLMIISLAFTAASGMYMNYRNYIELIGAYALVVFVYIVIAAAILLKDHEKIELGSHFAVCGYTVLIAFAVFAISVIEFSDREFGLENVILTFCGAWLADTGAYFAGTLFGRHKLCPGISPKKTVEGLIGGIVSNALFLVLAGFIISRIREGVTVNYTVLVFAGVFCAILGLIGDLLASLVKRSCGIKDFGKIMPGHGGALDRFDSVVFVAPFMMMLLNGAFPVFSL